MQLWKIWAVRWILIVLGKLGEHIKISATKRLIYYGVEKHKPWFE
jgi:hypothetical protein